MDSIKGGYKERPYPSASASFIQYKLFNEVNQSYVSTDLRWTAGIAMRQQPAFRTERNPARFPSQVKAFMEPFANMHCHSLQIPKLYAGSICNLANFQEYETKSTFPAFPLKLGGSTIPRLRTR